MTGRFVGLALTACIVISLLPMAGALDVDIGRPADGALLGSKSVHVNGTCSGAEMTAWTTAAPAGFQNGTADNIGLAPDGALTFPPEISDDFNGSGLNSSMWDSQPDVDIANISAGDSTISIWGGPSPSASDYCRIVTKSAYSFNPTTTSKTFECCATRQNMGDDWMAPLTVYCDDYHYVALSWGVGGEHGGSDTVMAMEVHTPSGHPSSIGGNVVCGRFYEFRLVVTPPSTFNGYYRAQGSDPWSLIASVSYSYDAMHSLLLGRPWVMGGGGSGSSGCLTADWVSDTGPGGWNDTFDSPNLNSTLWSSQPSYSISPGLSDRYLDIRGGPSQGATDLCRIRSRAPFTLNPAKEKGVYTARATRLSGNDWMGMLMLHSDDTHFAGISWGVDSSSGGGTDTISLVTWTPSGHAYLKSSALVPGTMYEFRLAVDPPGTLTGYYRKTSSLPWSFIGSADYSFNVDHSVLAGRPIRLGGGTGFGYSSRMVLDWVRQEPRMSGEYISPGHDAGCPYPVLGRIGWDWSASAGGDVSLFFRSAGDQGSLGAASWRQAANSVEIGTVCERFLQFRAVLSRTDSSDNTVLRSVSIVYSGIRDVMVSVDGVNWTVARGTDVWDVDLHLEEGKTRILVSATDCTGNTVESSVDVTVDTIPPEGEVLINGGAEFTAITDVVLALNATDATGVAEMLVSNKEDFEGAVWRPYSALLDWSLLTANGERTVYVKYRDRLGHESGVCTDSIFLDSLSPTTRITINHGDRYTRWTNVTVALSVSDNFRAMSIQLSADPYFSGASWQPFLSSVGFVLPDGEGSRTVYARAEDAAGNVGPAGTASIMLDPTAPISKMAPLPAETINTTLALNWSGSDASSGVRCFDVQCRDGDGVWSDLVSGTVTDGSRFTGQVGHTYSFRVRAQDNAGNIESFPEDAQLTVLVRLPRAPEVSIMYPQANVTIKGIYNITGISVHPEPGFKVTKVQIQMDSGEWLGASGTLGWHFPLDTTTLDNGPHVVRVRAYDGNAYSNVTERPFLVKNPPPPIPVQVQSGWGLLWAVLAILLVVAAVVAWMVYKRTRHAGIEDAPQEPPVPPLPASDFTGYRSVHQAPPPEPSRHPAYAQQGPLLEPVVPATPLIEKTPQMKLADEMAVREGRVLKALSSLPRGLPSSLWGLDMDVLASRVASGERRESPDGEMLVKINNRWYFGDEDNPGLFMQEYRK